MPEVLWIVLAVVLAALCFVLGIVYRKKIAEREIAGA